MSTEIALNPQPLTKTERSALEQLLDCELPSARPYDMQGWIQAQFAIGNRAALRIAVGVHLAYESADSPTAWLDWGQEGLQRDRKWMYNCLHAVDAMRRYTARLDPETIQTAGALVEKLALLDKLEPGEVQYFFHHHSLAEITRDGMRAAVRKIIGDREAQRTPQGGEDDGGDDAEEKQARKRAMRIETLVQKIADLDDDDMTDAAADISPAATARAMCHLFDILLAHLLHHGAWSPEQFAAANDDIVQRMELWDTLRIANTEPEPKQIKGDSEGD